MKTLKFEKILLKNFYLLKRRNFSLSTMVQQHRHRRYEITKLVIPTALKTPITLGSGNLTSKNRFFKSPMSEYTAHFDPEDLRSTGVPTKTIINAYEKWAYGGFGIMSTGAIILDKTGLNFLPGNMLIGEEEDSHERREGFEEIAKVANRYGSIILAQVFNIEDQMAFFKAQTDEERENAFDKTRYATKYLYERGFHGIILQILPAANEGVTDLDLTNRAIEEMAKLVRTTIPQNAKFILGTKLSTAKFQQAGVDYDQFVSLMKKVEASNYDFVEIAGGSIEFPLPKDQTRECMFAQVIKTIKEKVPKLPIFATGGFRRVSAMEDAVASGQLDGIGLARAAASEFDFPNKVVAHQIQSAMWSPFEDDMSLGVPAAAAQIAQAGKTKLEETEFDANYGIANFTSEEIKEAFINAKKVRDAEIEELKKEGKLIAGVVQM
jgi:2,4-dienoyl-CoA reductase-like NADH-dependent reductase (Old Yellow Enzyme family)